MSWAARFQSLYFDRAYIPVYEWTVARLAPYRRLQQACLSRLSLQEGCSLLSVGVGVGREIVALLERDGASLRCSLVAVDRSRQGLVRTLRNVRHCGGVVEAVQMDAHWLGFSAGQFDRVLCLHTMDFLEDTAAATREVLRVLRKGGEFVISYPSGRGGRGLGSEVVGSVTGALRQRRVAAAVKEALAALGAALLYAPLALSMKPRHGFYTVPRLEALLTHLGIREYCIEEDQAYQDLIVWGRS